MKWLNRIYQKFFVSEDRSRPTHLVKPNHISLPTIPRGRARTRDGAPSYSEIQYVQLLPSAPGAGQAIISYQLASSAAGLVALAGGGQPGATPIATLFARFDTVATGGDSSVLPAAIAGTNVAVNNSGAASMNVYPKGTTDIINALAVQTPFAVAAGKTCEFFCMVTGKWNTQLGA